MDEAASRSAAAANACSYDALIFKDYIDRSPHLKHASLQRVCSTLVTRLVDVAIRHTTTPEVLDLGAGEGSATKLFLEAGATVTAVDVSRYQLDALRTTCARFGDKLSVRCEDIGDTLKSASRARASEQGPQEPQPHAADFTPRSRSLPLAPCRLRKENRDRVETLDGRVGVRRRTRDLEL